MGRLTGRLLRKAKLHRAGFHLDSELGLKLYDDRLGQDVEPDDHAFALREGDRGAHFGQRFPDLGILVVFVSQTA